MLGYYLEWRMRQRLAPMLYDDDDKETAEALRPSVVAKAERSFAAVTKQTTSRTPDGLPRSPRTPSKSPPRRASPSPSPRARRPSRKRPSNSSIAPVSSRPFRPQEFASANQRIAHRESRKLHLVSKRPRTQLSQLGLSNGDFGRVRGQECESEQGGLMGNRL